MKFPDQANRLVKLLHEDQAEKKALGKAYFKVSKNEYESLRMGLKTSSRERTQQMLSILDEIKEPSLSNIGSEAAQAISVLALHDSIDVLRKVLDSFTALDKKDRDDTYFQAIPSMTDRLLLLEHKQQRFGTQWMFDENKQPFLPVVENFPHVNERRAEYGIEPIRWPKSLAIPESKQSWLKLPLSEAVIREPTNAEYIDFLG